LNALQQRVRDCVVNDCVYMDPELPILLHALEHPIHFLDFETFGPALPLFVGTKPYQAIPFQWSIHTLSEDGTLTHREYLHDGFDDPREKLAQSMIEALGDGTHPGVFIIRGHTHKGNGRGFPSTIEEPLGLEGWTPC